MCFVYVGCGHIRFTALCVYMYIRWWAYSGWALVVMRVSMGMRLRSEELWYERPSGHSTPRAMFSSCCHTLVGQQTNVAAFLAQLNANTIKPGWQRNTPPKNVLREHLVQRPNGVATPTPVVPY